LGKNLDRRAGIWMRASQHRTERLVRAKATLKDCCRLNHDKDRMTAETFARHEQAGWSGTHSGHESKAATRANVSEDSSRGNPSRGDAAVRQSNNAI
jgi:hypothetical protein